MFRILAILFLVCIQGAPARSDNEVSETARKGGGVYLSHYTWIKSLVPMLKSGRLALPSPDPHHQRDSAPLLYTQLVTQNNLDTVDLLRFSSGASLRRLNEKLFPEAKPTWHLNTEQVIFVLNLKRCV